MINSQTVFYRGFLTFWVRIITCFSPTFTPDNTARVENNRAELLGSPCIAPGLGYSCSGVIFPSRSVIPAVSHLCDGNGHYIGDLPRVGTVPNSLFSVIPARNGEKHHYKQASSCRISQRCENKRVLHFRHCFHTSRQQSSGP